MRKQNHAMSLISKSIFIFCFVLFFTMASAQMPIYISDNTKELSDSLSTSHSANRYFLFPSAFPLRKKEIYYRTFLFVHQLNAGITKNFELGLGTFPFFLYEGTSTPIWVAPKFSFPLRNKNFRIGINGALGTVIGQKNREETLNSFSNSKAITLIHGVLSYQNDNITISAGGGLGYLWRGSEQVLYSSIFSTLVRLGRGSFIMVESFVFGDFGDTDGLYFLGGRQVWENKVFLDFGFLVPSTITKRSLTSSLDFIALPWVNVAIPIGRKSFD